MYHNHLLKYKDAIAKAKMEYSATVIGTAQGNTRTLFTTLNNILLNHTTLSWFISYLSGHTQLVQLKNYKSHPSPVNSGVLQGSVLGPLLFIIYVLPLCSIFRNHGLNFHCYTDNTQLYLSCKPGSSLPPPSLLDCL